MAKLSQREKDMARRNQGRRPLSGAQKAAWAVAIVAVVGAGAYFVVPELLEDRECPGHWHASVGFYVDGQRVTIPQPPYNYDRDPVPGDHELQLHMHAPDQEQLHFEPRFPRCRGLEPAVGILGVDFDADSITFRDAHAGQPWAGTHTESGNSTFRVFLMAAGEGKREVDPGAVRGYQLRDNERALFLFGAYDDADITAKIEALKFPDGR